MCTASTQTSCGCLVGWQSCGCSVAHLYVGPVGSGSSGLMRACTVWCRCVVRGGLRGCRIRWPTPGIQLPLSGRLRRPGRPRVTDMHSEGIQLPHCTSPIARVDSRVARCRLEVICLLLCYKVKYPENVFLLRGNHEAGPINRASCSVCPCSCSCVCVCVLRGHSNSVRWRSSNAWSYRNFGL
jgi:hypothetical protein